MHFTKSITYELIQNIIFSTKNNLPRSLQKFRALYTYDTTIVITNTKRVYGRLPMVKHTLYIFCYTLYTFLIYILTRTNDLFKRVRARRKKNFNKLK